MVCAVASGDLTRLLPDEIARRTGEEVADKLNRKGIRSAGVLVSGRAPYPAGLYGIGDDPGLLYFRGDVELLNAPRRIAVIGSRTASDAGLARTHKLVAGLVDAGFAIVSGLARGIDTAAHRAAIARGGRTFAVIGTPICDVYLTRKCGAAARAGRAVSGG